MRLSAITSIISLLLCNSIAFILIPPINPQITTEIVDYANSLVDVLKEATLPYTWEEVIAIGVSEGVAGLVGGSVLVAVEKLIGDKKTDNFITEEAFAGAYFGARGLVRGLGQVAGLPQPVAIFFADIAGSIASEGAKAFGRRVNTERLAALEAESLKLLQGNNDDSSSSSGDSLGSVSKQQPSPPIITRQWINNYSGGRSLNIFINDTEGKVKDKSEVIVFPFSTSAVSSNKEMQILNGNDIEISVSDTSSSSLSSSSIVVPEENKSTATSFISIPEITMDIAKWVAYDLLLPDSDNVSLTEAARCGAEAGLLAIVLVELLRAARIFSSRDAIWNNVSLPTRLFRAGVEGAVLFWAYEGSLVYCNQMFPEKIKTFLERKFDFI